VDGVLRSPDRPARSQSLYQLSYLAHVYNRLYFVRLTDGKCPVNKVAVLRGKCCRSIYRVGLWQYKQLHQSLSSAWTRQGLCIVRAKALRSRFGCVVSLADTLRLTTFGCDTVRAQIFRLNPSACPITNSQLLSNVVNVPTSTLTDELLNSCNSFSCAACGSPCVFVIVNWCATGLEPGMPLKHLRTTLDLIPESLLNQCEGLRCTFPKTGTKCDAHSPFLSLIHRQNKSVWKLPTSTQLRATWHTDYLDMVVLPSTGDSRYQNCCIDGGASPEYFG
jgi:hypothetical protein